ncbi:OGG1 like 8-oxoguanine DNA glycosylase involved in DNA repair [Cryptosporidium ryanae]|uniref:OGG1 like 8-oxoguanine DNA glycosylase involved in DNA repair n=1 Tax=Cryptosporidium ryanae TaxID=515981 RepID=UPI00351A8BF6|nr:OGG1 like 8-oxoguanine DNA glycosylase involved in DNA repair [Cryptosporidium ryanae]
MIDIKYESLNVPKNELRITNCLPAGQSFSWRKVSKDSFVGVLGHRVFQVKELENDTLYRCIHDGCNNDNAEAEFEKTKKKKKIDSFHPEKTSSNVVFSAFHCCALTPHEHIRHYFNLDYSWENNSKSDDEPENSETSKIKINSLSQAYSFWGKSDPIILSSPKGIRLLNIDPIEALFVGVITANNNIQRISTIVQNIRKHFGTYLCDIRDKDITTSFVCTEDDFELIKDEKNGINWSSVSDDGSDEYGDEYNGDNNNFYNIENDSLFPNIDNQFNKKNKSSKQFQYYTFPTSLQILSNASEEILKEKCGVGYRAKSIILLAKKLSNFSSERKFIEHINSLSYLEASLYLQKFHGIGRKVADFVLLSGFGFTEAVPIDTHMLKYVCKHLKDFDEKTSLNKTRYVQAGNFFRDKFTLFPGWAQLVLFSSSVIK